MTTPTPREALAEREAFEAAMHEGHWRDFSITNGRYDNLNLQARWIGWQARAALAVPPGSLAEVQPIPEQSTDTQRLDWLEENLSERSRHHDFYPHCGATLRATIDVAIAAMKEPI